MRLPTPSPPHLPIYLGNGLGILVALAAGLVPMRMAFAQSDAQYGQIGADTQPTTDAGMVGDARTATADVQPPPVEASLASQEGPSTEDKSVVPDKEVVEVLGAIQGQDLATLDLETLLQNVVVTATKTEIKEDEAPAITTVIGREEIQRWGYQSVEDALHHVTGVYIINDQIVPNIAVRGISGGLRSESGLVKLMIDGRAVAFRSTAGNWLGPELIPMSAIQQIEVIRGPASSLYGADAFLGVINVVTRRPDQVEGGEISAIFNQNGLHSQVIDFTLGATHGNWQFLTAYKTSDLDHSGLRLPASSPAPKLPSYAPADLRAHDMTDTSMVTFTRVTYQLGKRGSISATAYYSKFDRVAEFADWQQLTHNLDSNGRQNGTIISLKQAHLGLTADLVLTPTLNLRANGTIFKGGPTARDRIEIGSDLFYVRRAFGYRGAEAGVEAAWHPNTTLNVLLGVGILQDYEDLPTVYDVLKSNIGDKEGERAGNEILATGTSGEKYFGNIGANALVMWSPYTRITFTGGLRYDRHSVYGDKVSGRLGGVAKLLSNLHLKILYGSAFKAPSPQLLYGSPLTSGDIEGNEDLKPSYIHTVEGQISWRPNRHLLMTTGVAYSYLLDQATFAQRGINQVALNISKVGSISWESELRFDYKRKLAAFGNLVINQTRSSSSEDNYVAYLSNYQNIAYPKVTGNMGVSAEIPRLPLRIGTKVTYVGIRRSSSANTLEAGGKYDLKAYHLIDATIRSVGLHIFGQKETTLMLVLRNLSDSTYADPGFAGIDYPQHGRTFLFQANQEF
jgi:outer membrane receptor for ferrienterochelin and colicins